MYDFVKLRFADSTDVGKCNLRDFVLNKELNNEVHCQLIFLSLDQLWIVVQLNGKITWNGH